MASNSAAPSRKSLGPAAPPHWNKKKSGVKEKAVTDKNLNSKVNKRDSCQNQKFLLLLLSLFPYYFFGFYFAFLLLDPVSLFELLFRLHVCDWIVFSSDVKRWSFRVQNGDRGKEFGLLMPGWIPRVIYVHDVLTWDTETLKLWAVKY